MPEYEGKERRIVGPISRRKSESRRNVDKVAGFGGPHDYSGSAAPRRHRAYERRDIAPSGIQRERREIDKFVLFNRRQAVRRQGEKRILDRRSTETVGRRKNDLTSAIRHGRPVTLDISKWKGAGKLAKKALKPLAVIGTVGAIGALASEARAASKDFKSVGSYQGGKDIMPPKPKVK